MAFSLASQLEKKKFQKFQNGWTEVRTSDVTIESPTIESPTSTYEYRHY